MAHTNRDISMCHNFLVKDKSYISLSIVEGELDGRFYNNNCYKN